MTDLDLIIDLHKDGVRQGPGSAAALKQAVALAGLEPGSALEIADIGCGTGAATRVLAQTFGGRITAVDLFPQFLDVLEAEARGAGFGDRIKGVQASMEALPFAPERFDLIVSEGAIYNMGFEAGIAAWRRFLKPGGVLAVSELTWFTAERPEPLQAHWAREYSGLAPASANIARLERSGYAVLGYFPLSEACWLDAYYRPMQARFPAFLERHTHSAAAQAIVAAEEAEIALYEQYKDYYGYGYYIARKVGA